MANPCEQLAALKDEVTRLAEEYTAALQRWREAEQRKDEAENAYSDRCSELGVPYMDPSFMEEIAEDCRAMGDEETAEIYESAAEVLQPLWDECRHLLFEEQVCSRELSESRARLHESRNRLRSLAHSLMEECGLVQEMSDPMASFDHHLPGPADPSPIPDNAQIVQQTNSESRDQASATAPGAGQTQPTTSVTAETMRVQQPETTSAGTKAFGYTHMHLPPAPEIETTPETLEAARLFNNLPERSTPGAVESTPSVTAETMQVQQPGSANTGTSSFGYTHMPVPQTAGQSGAAVAPPPKSLRILTPVKRMRISPGLSIKR
jgi:hypothetical protein